MDTDKPLPVLRARPRDLASHALVVGDPQRAADAAQLLENPREVGHYREYRTFTGEYAGRRITVCSHGVGAAGASLCFAELFAGGVKTVIRAGTCGALAEVIDVGELIVGTGAIREDGTSQQLVPLAYPAVADRRVVLALEEVAEKRLGRPPYVGLVLTQAYLYPGLLPTTIELWMRAGVICVEMELAALLVMASLEGVSAGGIFTVDGNLARKQQPGVETTSYDPHREVVSQAKQRMLEIALEALARF